MNRENPLHAFAKGDAAHSECLMDTTSLAGNDDPGKDLDTLLVPFLDPGVYADTVAHLEMVAVRLQLLLRDFVNNGIHF